jgi:rubredoxin
MTPQMTQLTPMPDDWECSICLDGKDAREIVAHDCKKHWFHKECLDEAMRRSFKCPICRYSKRPEVKGIIIIPMHRDEMWHDVNFWIDNLYNSIVVINV